MALAKCTIIRGYGCASSPGGWPVEDEPEAILTHARDGPRAIPERANPNEFGRLKGPRFSTWGTAVGDHEHPHHRRRSEFAAHPSHRFGNHGPSRRRGTGPLRGPGAGG